jgi:hypothetical protein
MTNKSEVRMRGSTTSRHASMIMLVTEDHPRWIRSRMMAGLDAAIR